MLCVVLVFHRGVQTRFQRDSECFQMLVALDHSVINTSTITLIHIFVIAIIVVVVVDAIHLASEVGKKSQNIADLRRSIAVGTSAMLFRLFK